MLVVTLLCMVCVYVYFGDHDLCGCLARHNGANLHTEIKMVIAAVYTNFRTHVVDDEGIEQIDGYTTGPRSNQLILRFEKVEQ